MSVHAAAPSVVPDGMRRASDVARSIDTDGLPLSTAVESVLPWPRLRRGTTLTVASAGPAGLTSLLLALLAGPSGSGAWCALVGAPTVSASAIRRSGVDASRLALVPHPGDRWESVVGALLEGIDVVAVHVPGRISPSRAARLSAKTRRQKGVLVAFGGDGTDWPQAEARLTVEQSTWYGLGWGRGLLRHCELTVSTRHHGRRATATVWPYGVRPEPVRRETEQIDIGAAGVTSLADHRQKRKGVSARAILRPPLS